MNNILVHHIDADGFMSRFLMEEYSSINFSECYPYNYWNYVTEWQQLVYKLDEKSVRSLHYFFVDVTPPLLWVEEMLSKYPEQFQITVIDHHPIINKFIKLSKKYPQNIHCKCSLELAGCQLCLYYVKEHYVFFKPHTHRKYCK